MGPKYAERTANSWHPDQNCFFMHLMTKPKKMACAPSEDSDQPGHPPSLIRVFAVRIKKAWVLSYPMNAQWRLWSDWADAQADLSLCWAHMPFCWFCHDAARMSWSWSLLYNYFKYLYNYFKIQNKLFSFFCLFDLQPFTITKMVHRAMFCCIFLYSLQTGFVCVCV